MRTTTFKCNNCSSGPCYVCTKDLANIDMYGNPGDNANTPTYCPLDEYETPRFRICASPAERCGVRWLVETLKDWVDEHYDECPEHVKAACYGALIQPSSNWRLKYINLLRMFADDDQYYGCYGDDVKKAIGKMTKEEIINSIIPEAFAAGVIYDFIRRTTEEYKGAEDPEGDD